MKAFVSGISLGVLIAIGAALILNSTLDMSSATVYTSDKGSVRLDPGMGKRPGEH
ncbi:hypothetical protein [Breoghania sp.]|uniref:hypothetical protein n=1 Tax=Breoghania sp. TaxID=2065378 RepID=UPI002AA817F8|nr:hypothetical protein [Breoghania sp.]